MSSNTGLDTCSGGGEGLLDTAGGGGSSSKAGGGDGFLDDHSWTEQLKKSDD